MLGNLCDSELKHTESLLTFVFVAFFFAIKVDCRKFTHEFTQLVQQNWIFHTLMGEKKLNERSTL